MHKKPMVAMCYLGGSVEKYIDGYLGHRENVKILGADTPKGDVEKILELLSK